MTGLRSKIFHICLPDRWRIGADEIDYTDPSLATEGFIHCSTREQLDATLKRYFIGTPEVLILEISPMAVANILRFEPASHSQERFPHVYGPIPRSAVVAIHRFDWSCPVSEVVTRTVRSL